MATAGFAGFVGQLFMATAGSTSAPASNAVAELKDVTITAEMEEMDSFSKDSSGWAEFLPGRRRWGGTATAIYRDSSGSTGHALVWNAIYSRETAFMTFRVSSSSGIMQYMGTIVPTSYEVSSPENAIHGLNFAFRGTSAIARQAATS